MKVDNMIAVRALALIRLANGALALLAPEVLLRRLGAQAGTVGMAKYPFRMFGIRTVLIGSDLLILRGSELERAVRAAVVIHSLDTVCAAVGGLRREVPLRTAVMTTAVSAVNAALAITALQRARG